MSANGIRTRTGRVLRAIFAVIVALGMGPPACATRIMVVSDLHYMAPALYEGSDLFLRVLRAGDGKLTQHGDALMAALRQEAVRQAPDALIVTGDLAFNGEKASHEALTEWFAGIEAEGVPVWVIPGNHDINVPTARRFDGDGWTYAPTVSPEEFRAIYRDYLPPEAQGAPGSFSYPVKVDDRLWVAMTDVAFHGRSCRVAGGCPASGRGRRTDHRVPSQPAAAHGVLPGQLCDAGQ